MKTMIVLQSSGGSLNAGPAHGLMFTVNAVPRVGEKIDTGEHVVVVVDIIHKVMSEYVILKVK